MDLSFPLSCRTCFHINLKSSIGAISLKELQTSTALLQSYLYTVWLFDYYADMLQWTDNI